jgi:NAD(P)-dependent dehydrogenase (short-subunit alcohol dehydrogenase family)
LSSKDRNQSDTRFVAVETDLVDPASPRHIVEVALAAHGRIDGVVNNVAGTQLYPGFQDIPEDQWMSRQFVEHLDGSGRRLLVRNGYHQPRQVLTAAGAIEPGCSNGRRHHTGKPTESTATQIA